MTLLLKIVDQLSVANRLSAADVRTAAIAISTYTYTAGFRRELRDISVGFWKTERYGRLRAAILIGLTLNGQSMLSELESSGIFLAPPLAIPKFGTFLQRLKLDVTGEKEWALLEARIPSYEAYLKLVDLARPQRELLRRSSRQRLRTWTKQLLCIVEMAFRKAYFATELPDRFSEAIAVFDSPEELASAASTALAMANEVAPLDTLDLGSPIMGDLLSTEVTGILYAARILNLIKETSNYVCCYSYSLRLEAGSRGPVVITSPPTPEFERALQMGFIRGELGLGKVTLDMCESGRPAAPTLLQFSEHFITRSGNRVIQIASPGTPYRRVRLHLPLIPSLSAFLQDTTFADEEVQARTLVQDFMLPLSGADGLPPRLTPNLTYRSFQKLFKLLRFYSGIDCFACKPYAKGEFLIFKNSLVRIITESGLRGMLELTGEAPPAIADFINIVAADTSSLGHYDLQYSPLLKLKSVKFSERPSPEREYLLLPSGMISSNEIRSSQIRSRTRFHQDGHAFVSAVVLELQSAFPDVVSNKRLKLRDLKTEVDIALLCGGKLFLIECKHSLTATDPHEMRDLWRDINKGVNQINKARMILSDEDRRLSYLKAWFPKLSAHQIMSIEVIGGVLSSHRLFSGLELDHVSVRDFASLSRLIENGTAAMGFTQPDGSAVMSTFRDRDGADLTVHDLENYFSPASRFHQMYFFSMKPQHVIQRAGNFLFAKESFAYEVDLEGWQTYMHEHGYARMDDQYVSMPQNFDFEEILPSGSNASYEV